MPKQLLVLAIAVALALPIAAQVASPAQPEPNRTPPQAAQTPLVPTSNLAPLLTQLEQAAMQTNGDIARLRIDKWKADSASKRDAQSMAEAVQRNLTNALPGMIAAVRSTPDNLAATFTLYRNLDTLYDVLSTLSNTTGALGPRQDYEPLARDTASVEQVRRALADQIQSLASFKDSEVSRLMVQLRTAQAAVAAAPPKKVVVDDEAQTVKKPVRKKKAAAKPAQTQTPPQQSPTPPRQ